MAKEQKWLPVLAPQLPLAVPLPVAAGEPDATFPYPWSVAQWLPGELATPDRLDHPVRPTSWATPPVGRSQASLGACADLLEFGIAVGTDHARRIAPDGLFSGPPLSNEPARLRCSTMART